jgi:hypothetical protein
VTGYVSQGVTLEIEGLLRDMGVNVPLGDKQTSQRFNISIEAEEVDIKIFYQSKIWKSSGLGWAKDSTALG